jgi:hypothetical protein
MFEKLVGDLFEMSSRKYKILPKDDKSDFEDFDFDIADVAVRLPPLPLKSSANVICDNPVDSTTLAAREARNRSEVEAVYVSFAVHGAWDPETMVLPHEHAPTMGGLKFLALCRAAGLTDDSIVTPEVAKDLMFQHADKKTRLLTFETFLDAVASIARVKKCSQQAVLASIRAVNAQGLLSIRVCK